MNRYLSDCAAMASACPPSYLAQTSTSCFGDWLAGITAVFLIGAAAGGLLFGWLGDRWGGRRALALYVVGWSLAISTCS